MKEYSCSMEATEFNHAPAAGVGVGMGAGEVIDERLLA